MAQDIASSSHKNVIFVTPVLHNGGAERVLSDIANGLVAHGHGVEIISLAYEADVAHLDTRIKIRFLNDEKESAERGGSPVAKIVRRVRLLSRLWHALRQRAPDGVIIGFLEPCAQYLWNLRLLGGPRYLVSLHAYEFIYYADFYRSPLRRRVEAWFLSMACRAADWVTVPSDGCRRDLISHFAVPPAKVRTIQNPVNLDEIRRQACVVPDMPHPLDGATLFIQAARLVKQKNRMLLVEACKILREKHENFVVWCCGEGTERPVIEAAIAKAGLQKHIRLLGQLGNPYTLMAQARGVLLTSEYESFGLVLVEAMIAGTPAIATDCNSGPDEVLSDGAGLLVPRNDAVAFADAMLKLMQDDALYEKLRGRGALKACEYAIDNIVVLWQSLLSDVPA